MAGMETTDLDVTVFLMYKSRITSRRNELLAPLTGVTVIDSLVERLPRGLA